MRTVLANNINAIQRKQGQVLDTLQVERERGITVKAQTASMIFLDERTNGKYLVNLIDTPDKKCYHAKIPISSTSNTLSRR